MGRHQALKRLFSGMQAGNVNRTLRLETGPCQSKFHPFAIILVFISENGHKLSSMFGTCTEIAMPISLDRASRLDSQVAKLAVNLPRRKRIPNKNPSPRRPLRPRHHARPPDSQPNGSVFKYSQPKRGPEYIYIYI